ncbi:MAG TPA: hypothetical protein VM899_16540, partial [Rubellimicrobium sp.]|nr:hypothetical protein [Rubellimicrobium sp.]
MPLDLHAAYQALVHLPIPHDVPRGHRRIADPTLEAYVATRWLTRQTWEADGYAFPDHPRPRVPRALRGWHPELAAEDDARDAEVRRLAETRATPNLEPACRPDDLLGGRASAHHIGTPNPRPRCGKANPAPPRPNPRATALARRDARRSAPTRRLAPAALPGVRGAPWTAHRSPVELRSRRAEDPRASGPAV